VWAWVCYFVMWVRYSNLCVPVGQLDAEPDADIHIYYVHATHIIIWHIKAIYLISSHPRPGERLIHHYLHERVNTRHHFACEVMRRRDQSVIIISSSHLKWHNHVSQNCVSLYNNIVIIAGSYSFPEISIRCVHKQGVMYQLFLRVSVSVIWLVFYF